MNKIAVGMVITAGAAVMAVVAAAAVLAEKAVRHCINSCDEADMYFTYKVFRLDFQSGLLHRRTGVYPQFDCAGRPADTVLQL